MAPASCALCPPRNPAAENRYEIASLSISTLYLYGDQRFRGYSVLTFDARHAVALAELSKNEYMRYMDDLRISVQAIIQALHPDHNKVEQMVGMQSQDDSQHDVHVVGMQRLDDRRHPDAPVVPVAHVLLLRKLGECDSKARGE